ncbi:LysR substrate-binding domain-containing protein [Thalassotalea fusca]
MEKALRNLNLLRTYESAARLNSYSKAANELCISQAAVSQQMRQLESILGSQLFVRKSKQMLLTAKGKTLLEATQQALSILQKGINDVSEETLAGELTVTSTQAFTALWLMPRLHKFLALYPDIEIRILSSANFEDLKEHHIDLAIRFGINVEQNTADSLTCEYIGQDKVIPVCSAKLATEHHFNAPEDLLNTWLVSIDSRGPYDWQAWFDHYGSNKYQTHQRWTKVQSTDMALNAVLNGHGCAMVAHYLCGELLAAGELVIPLDLPHPNVVKRYFVYDPSSAKLKRLALFMAWIRKELNLQFENNR